MTKLFHGRQNLIICLCLAVVIGAVYRPVRHFEFVNYDDGEYVAANTQVQGGLTLRGLVWAFTTNHASNWHPLTWLSHMLDCQLFGMNAGAHHQVNVLFHVVNTLLLFGVLKRMTAAPWRSAFVAALFALHPLHVESVAWVAERKDVLSTCFWMLTMWAYVRYVERPDAARYWLTFGLYALGLMAKPMVVTLPFVLLLLDYWPLGRTQWAESANGDNNGKTLLSRLLWEKVPFLALAAASCVVTFWAQHAGGSVASLARLPIRVRVPNATVSYLRYIEKMFWPNGLAAFYPFRIWSPGIVLGAVVVLAGVSVIVIGRARRQPHLIVGWLWYLGTLVPVIGLVQVGDQSIADRYTYVPSIGLLLMLCWSMPGRAISGAIFKVITCVIAGAVLIVCAALSRIQVGYWKDSEALFRHALNVTRDNCVAHNNLGLALAGRGKLMEGIEQYEQALRIKPDFAEAHNNLGLALAGQGKVSEAIAEFAAALRIMPGYAKAHNNLGNALFGLGKVPEAIGHYEQALRIKPDNVGAHYNLGVALAGQGRVPEAMTQYREALRLKPDLSPALHKLAWILATDGNAKLRNAGEAVQFAERLCAITEYQQVDALDVLAAAYAEAGRFNDAIQAAQKALELEGAVGQQELAPNGHSGLAKQIQERLKLYQAGRPFHEGPVAQMPPS